MPKIAEIVKVKGATPTSCSCAPPSRRISRIPTAWRCIAPPRPAASPPIKVTEFAEAERRLAEWEDAAKTKKGVRDFYADFVKALAQVSPGTLRRQGQDPVVCGGARDQQRSAGCCEAQFRGSEENGQGVATRPQRLSDCSKSAGRP